MQSTGGTTRMRHAAWRDNQNTCFWWSGKDAIRHRAEHIWLTPDKHAAPPKQKNLEGGMGARPTTASPAAAISNKSADQGCTICEQHRRHPLRMCLTRQRPQYAHTEHNEALTRAAPRTRSRCFQQTPGTTPAPGQRKDKCEADGLIVLLGGCPNHCATSCAGVIQPHMNATCLMSHVLCYCMATTHAIPLPVREIQHDTLKPGP